MANFNGIDYVILTVLFLSIGMGIFRGFVKEVISIIAWVAAFTVATLYAIPFAALFSSAAAHSPGVNAADTVSTLAVVISYLVLFASVLIAGSILKFIVNYIVEGKGISITNRLLGALLGFVRGAVIVILAMFFIDMTAMAAGALWKESEMVKYFEPAVKWVDKMAQPYLTEIAAKMKKAARGANEEEMTDVIKHKAASSPSPAIVVEPAKPQAPVAAPVPTQAPAAPTPAAVPVPAPVVAPAATH